MVNLSKFGIGTSNLSRICGEALETDNQIFVECGTIKEV